MMSDRGERAAHARRCSWSAGASQSDRLHRRLTDGFCRRAGVLLRRSITKGTAAPLVRRSRRTPRSVPCQRHSLIKLRSERLPTAGRLTSASHGSHQACVEMPREGVSECCSGARARRERKHHRLVPVPAPVPALVLVLGTGRTARSVPRQSHSLTKPHLQPE